MPWKEASSISGFQSRVERCLSTDVASASI